MAIKKTRFMQQLTHNLKLIKITVYKRMQCIYGFHVILKINRHDALASWTGLSSSSQNFFEIITRHIKDTI
jgi:hypothetical protein